MSPSNQEILVATISRENDRSFHQYKSRLGSFADWLTETNRTWTTPDLIAYREHLLSERALAPTTVNAHLSSIRTRYRALFNDGTIEAELRKLHQTDDAVQEAIVRLHTAVFGGDIRLKEDRAARDKDYLRLKAKHVIALLESPGHYKLIGLRDTAVIALLFTTGLRAFELCALQVSDLEHTVDGQPALHVPPGRGCTERSILYGALTWGISLTKAWLEEARISEGPVFKGFYKDGRSLRPTGLSVRALINLLAGYPLDLDGEQVTVSPMDLRRAYARLLYEAGVELGIIMANLGLRDSNALTDYIGGRDASLGSYPGVDFFDEATLIFLNR